MKNSHITIKDIAKKLGISPSTVSRALKNHPDISEDTKIAVKKLAEELNYNPNAIALSLRNQRSNIIGVIIPQIIHHFFSSVISGIEDVASNHGYHVMIFQSNESYEREVMNTKALLSSRAEGVIISMTKSTENYEHFISLHKRQIPLVFFDRICPLLDTDRVIINDYKAAYSAVEHLISLGCKKISHFAGPQSLEIGKMRLKGYIDALKKYKYKIDEQLIVYCDDFELAKMQTNELIKKGIMPDAIFAVNDMTAIGTMAALRENKIKIPDQVAVVGFTNGMIARVCDPPLTTIEQHGFLMGQKAAEMLISRIENIATRPSRIEIIPTEIVVRQSTMRKLI